LYAGTDYRVATSDGKFFKCENETWFTAAHNGVTEISYIAV